MRVIQNIHIYMHLKQIHLFIYSNGIVENNSTFSTNTLYYDLS